MSKRIFQWVSVVVLVVSFLPGAALPLSAAQHNIEVRLLADRGAVTPGQPFTVGIRMKIRDGWHTYWKNPGDAGLAPRIEWTLPAGFVAGPIEWPAPERFAEGASTTYGYHREVILPVRITPPGSLAGDSVTISGKIDWLECKDVCLSGSGILNVVLATSREAAPPGRDASVLDRARSRLPRDMAGWSLSAERGPRAIAVQFVPPAGVAPRGAYFFVDQPLVVEHAEPQGFERTETGYRLTMTPAANAAARLDRLTGVLTVELGGNKQMSIQAEIPVNPGDPAPAPPPPPATAPLPPIAYAGAFGIVGLAVALWMRRLSRGKSHTV